MFEATYQPLSSDHPEWGEIAILPWDVEIFGFPVADWRGGDFRTIAQAPNVFQDALTNWADMNKVEIISCSVAGNDARGLALLPSLGFTFVDLTFQVVNRRIQETDFPTTRAPVRAAELSDQAELERIAEHAFGFGRYHCDARLPREFADLRYRRWLRNAFASLSSGGHITVVGNPGSVKGFVHTTVSGTDAHGTIGGIAKEVQGTGIGADLIGGWLSILKAKGIRTADSKVSAANTQIVNFVPYFGFRFRNPQAVYHWHAPNAPHLIPLEQIYT